MDGLEEEAMKNMEALVEEPFASVLRAIFDAAESDMAESILGADLVAILRAPDMQRLIRLTWPSRMHAEEIIDSPS